MANDVKKISIDGVDYVRADAIPAPPAPLTGKHPRVPLPFGVGDSILIRTVTMIQLGRVRTIGGDFLVLEDGGWVADTGRFSTMLEKGTINEFERVPSWMLIGRGAIVDVFPWPHELPKATK